MRSSEFYENLNCPVSIYQLKWEFEKLLEIYRKRSPSRILEIGSLFGGTLWHWMSNSMAGSQFTIVDKIISKEKEEFYKKQTSSRVQWEAWAITYNQFLAVYNSSSQDDNIYKNIKRNAPFDFIFIDGDHSYNGVKDDYIKYKKLITPGGIIVFHDIVYSKYYKNIEVYKLWKEIKEEGNITQELYSSPDQICLSDGAGYGIGIVYF